MTQPAIAPVRSGESRAGGLFRMLNGSFQVKVNGDDSHGQLAIFDTERFERGGPPLHYHTLEDEWFLVTDGVFDFHVGGVEHRLMTGDSILGPRGVPHAFTNVSETGGLLIAFTPAGRMEQFFRTIAGLDRPSPPEFNRISGEFGMPVVGPPLPIRDV